MKPSRDQLRDLLRDQSRRIWTNQELDDMLGHGLCWWNMVSPATSVSLDELRKGAAPNAEVQQAAVLWASVVLSVAHLLQPTGLKSNVDLDVDERHKYESLLENAEEMFESSKLTKERIIAAPPPSADEVWH